MKKFIQIFLDSRMMTGINAIRVTTITMNDVFRLVPINKKLMAKAATAKAIPTA